MVGARITTAAHTLHRRENAVNLNRGRTGSAGCDCVQALAQSKGDVQPALQQFEKRRLPDLHALFALDRTAMARVGVGVGAKWNPCCLVQTFHTKLGLMLGKHVPGCSPMPEIMRISSERLPFRQVGARVCM